MKTYNVTLTENEIRAIKALIAYRLTYLVGLGEPSGTPTALQVANLQQVLIVLSTAQGIKLRAGVERS